LLDISHMIKSALYSDQDDNIRFEMKSRANILTSAIKIKFVGQILL
jgi:hypothetical protein